MLTVHHLGISQSDRIVWLCEELGLAYDLVLHARDPQTMLAPPELVALHPVGTAPIIADGDLVLAETGAIMDYIAARLGKGRLRPGPDDADFATYLLWYHLINASLMPALMMKMGAPGPMVDLMDARLGRYFGLLEDHLGSTGPWLAGERFTDADIMAMFPLVTMRHFVGVPIASRPNILAYVERLEARPAYRAMRAKADPGLVLPPAQ